MKEEVKKEEEVKVVEKPVSKIPEMFWKKVDTSRMIEAPNSQETNEQ